MIQICPFPQSMMKRLGNSELGITTDVSFNLNLLIKTSFKDAKSSPALFLSNLY